MKTILAVVGDYYHPEQAIKAALEKAAAAVSGREEIRLRYTTADRLAEGLAGKPDAAVLFKENRVNPQDEQVKMWMTEAAEAAIVSYVREGGGWLAWHSGLASYREDGAYVAMLRGYFKHHPDKHQIVRYEAVSAGGGPLGLAGAASAFGILDEHYFVYCDEANTNVFLRSASVDGESIAGWSHAFGRGRVLCLTPAHNPEGLLHPGMIDTLGASIVWCAGG